MKKNVKNMIKLFILLALVFLVFSACEDLFNLFQDPPAEESPSPVPELVEDCVSFNNATIEVVEIDGRWKIVDGSHWIMDFESNEAEARKAFDILKFYSINSQCFVGRPDPSLTYLLSNGQAPVGEYPGEDAIAFNPDNIEVVQIDGRWKIVEGSHWILDFESNEAEAREAFAIIKHYGFEYICFVGRPDASLIYFRKDSNLSPITTRPPAIEPTLPPIIIKPM